MDSSDPQRLEAVLGRWSDGSGPLHRKLAEALRLAVRRGHLAVGQRLPSERELATRLSVSRSTVVTAYNRLRTDGVVESRQGSGTRVRGDPDRRSVPHQVPLSPVYRALLDDQHSLISTAAAALPAHPRVAEALREVAIDDAAKLLSDIGYHPAGLPELREQVATLYTAGGLPTPTDQVIITTGAQQALNLAASVLVRPGDHVIVESPSFAGTLDVFRPRGGRLVAAPVDEDGVDVTVVRDLLASERTGAIYVMPSYHNPTGILMSERRRRMLAELARDAGVPIIEDNALEHAPLDDIWLPPVAAFASDAVPVLTVGSMSKAAWGGLRIGWLRGPAPLIDRAAELKAMADLSSPLLEQAIVARILPHLDELRRDNRTLLRRHLEVLTGQLTEHLPTWSWSPPRGGGSLWVRLPAGAVAVAFAQVALRHGVELIPGESMSATAEHRDHFRFPFTAEVPVLEETVRRLAAAWRDYAPDDGPRPCRSVIV